MREKKKMKGKSGGAGPAFVSCWPLYEVNDFVRESVKHKRLVFILNWIGITHFFCSTVTNFSSPAAVATSRDCSLCDDHPELEAIQSAACET